MKKIESLAGAMGMDVNITAIRLTRDPNEREVSLLQRYIQKGDEIAYNTLKSVGLIVEKYPARNLIVTAGRNVIARLLSGDNTYSGEINDGALGSGSTAVNTADTTLDTEVYRKGKVSAAASDNIVYVDFVYTASDTNGTYNEFGTFIDGDGVGNPDTGVLFTRVLTGGWVKSASESLFISCRYTMTSS